MKYVKLLILLLISGAVGAQTMSGPSGYGIQQDHIAALKFFRPPVLNDTICDLVLNATNGACYGAIVILRSNNKMYRKDSVSWKEVGAAGIAKAIDSLRYDPPTATFYTRYTTGGEVAVPTGLVDSLKSMTLQRVTGQGDTTNHAMTTIAYGINAQTYKQRSANMRVSWLNAADQLYGAVGDLGSSDKMEIAGYGNGLSLTSANASPVQIRTNNLLIINADDSLVTVQTPLIAAPPTQDHHAAEKIYVDTIARNAVWRTQLTPLLTQPALAIQPSDTLTQALGKLQAQINNINGSIYIQNQNTAPQTASQQITGQISTTAGSGRFGGFTRTGFAGPAVELGYNGTIGIVQAYDGVGATFKALKIDGLTTSINSGTAGNVGIGVLAPSFPLDITGTTRISGANFKMFFERTSIASQDNAIAWTSPNITTGIRDTVGYVGNISRSDNDIFIYTRASNLNIRHRVDSQFRVSVYTESPVNRKNILIEKNGKWLYGDSITSVAKYTIEVSTSQDTAISANAKIASSKGFAGPILPGIRTVTASATLLATDHTVLVNNTGGAATQTLPTAASCPGLVLTIKKVSAAANNVNIQPAGAELLDGSNAAKILTLQWSAITVQSNGVSWFATDYYLASTIL